MGDSNWPGNRPHTDILPALPEAGDLVLDAMKRFLASTFLTAMLALPGAVWAQSVQDQIIAQLTQQGCALRRLHLSHPDSTALAQALPLDDPRVEFHSGPAGFEAEFDTPHGRRVLR